MCCRPAVGRPPPSSRPRARGRRPGAGEAARWRPDLPLRAASGAAWAPLRAFGGCRGDPESPPGRLPQGPPQNASSSRPRRAVARHPAAVRLCGRRGPRRGSEARARGGAQAGPRPGAAGLRRGGRGEGAAPAPPGAAAGGGGTGQKEPLERRGGLDTSSHADTAPHSLRQSNDSQNGEYVLMPISGGRKGGVLFFSRTAPGHFLNFACEMPKAL